VGGGVQTGSTRHVGHLLAYCTCPGWLWGWRNWWNEWQGKPKYSEKTCPDATLSTTNPTWPDPGLNPGRRGGKKTGNSFWELYIVCTSSLFLERSVLAHVTLVINYNGGGHRKFDLNLHSAQSLTHRSILNIIIFLHLYKQVT
jgi:hypothetical protein